MMSAMEVPALVVEQQAAEHGLLGFHGLRRDLSDSVADSILA
jgi:hypothetical protein